jgi:hypothetical protein
MDRAAVYAEAVASLVNAYESAKLFRELGDKMVSGAGDRGYAEVREWLNEVRGAPEHVEMLDLAVLVRELATRGEAERAMCRRILESVIAYVDAKSETSFLGY